MTKKKQLTPENSGFRADQNIEIKGGEFALFHVALDQLFENLKNISYPIHYKTVDANGEPFEEATEEDFKEGRANQVLDVAATFNPDNAVVAYCGNISYPMLEAMRLRYDIQLREISKGNAVDNETLFKEFEEEQKPKLEVVQDGK